MSKPAKSGAIIYSKSVNSLADFYIKMFGMALLRETDEFITLGGDGINLVIHVPPVEMPEQNFNTVKLFLTVESHGQLQRHPALFFKKRVHLLNKLGAAFG